ncbi:transcriptional corepressor LEUNIG_HOMOLOG-like [Telopea speciosissima]|uniref:transcriptional corepressor LEUNIG_HOMOLOG-like n=1 Tax=Telopea speciosissima TaxID=54955 RepID=UPI001CC37D24|nr:transcriptional corepressor LEUNIG_HOMOLOG-like [Telopea speciosissima]
MDDLKWDADKMLNLYIHDYMMKKKLHKAAQIFRNEAKITSPTVVIDCPGGFLLDWWSIFYDKYSYREQQAKELSHGNALKGEQIMDVNQESIRPWLQQYEMNQRRLGQLPTEIGFANMPATGMLAAQIYEEQRLGHPFSKTLPPDIRVANCGKMTSCKSMVPNLGNVHQQACAETQQCSMRGGRQGVRLSSSHPSEPTLYGVPKAMIPISGPSEAELNKGISSIPLSGWPLAGIDQIPPGLGKQVLKSHLQTPIQQQFQMLTAKRQQELIVQSLTHTPPNLMPSLSGTSADLDLRRLLLLKGGLNVKDEQMSGSVDSQQIIYSSTGAVSKIGGEVPKDEMMFQMRQITDRQRQQYQLQQQELSKVDSLSHNPNCIIHFVCLRCIIYRAFSSGHLYIAAGYLYFVLVKFFLDAMMHVLNQGVRKRKELSYSVAASGTMAGDTPGTYAESLMCDKISTPIALSQNYRTSGTVVAHGCDRTGLAETSGKDGRHDVAEGSSDANVESFLSHDTDIDDLRGTPFSTLLQSSTGNNRIASKGFSFGEVCSLSSSKSKVFCCHFSSDGKLLASAGHDKKVVVWNLDTFDFKSSSEDHSLLITDVRFRQSSSILATSSFDKTVQIWDTNDFSHSLCKLIGHSEQVMSLDFHPQKTDLLCSCDRNNEIWLWNVNRRQCTRISKGGMAQVRFQPQVGQLLAAASGNTINIHDVETGSVRFNLKGHIKEVQSICWDTSGKYIASVSEDRIRVWSALSGGEFAYELCSSDNKFQSCIFHPRYSLLLVIGGYQSLELWNPMSTCKTKTFPAHDGLITALTNSPSTEMVASASHDGYVKLWK